MRHGKLAAALAVVSAAGSAHAQSSMSAPVGDVAVYRMDSGVVTNLGTDRAAVFSHDVHRDGAAWLQLMFSDVVLPPGLVLRITGMHDGGVQELDQVGIQMWQHHSAYFNGDTVRIELVAMPGLSGRVVLEMIAFEVGGDHEMDSAGGCGICGADDRVPSSEDFACRLLPAGCSATVYSDQSCLVTAGHCVDNGGAAVIEFRVPPSSADCTLNHPPVEDQFPIIDDRFENIGIGNDWGVLLAGQNNEGVSPWTRYGALRPIAPLAPEFGETVTVWGYGVDSECVRNQVQQTSGGTINGIGSKIFTHDADTTFGNSGSGMQNAAGEIIGIATNCGCPTNTAMRVDDADFFSARAQICGCYGDVNFDNVVDISDLLKVLSKWGATGEQSADLNDDGIVDVLDLLIVLGAWGPC